MKIYKKDMEIAVEIIKKTKVKVPIKPTKSENYSRRYGSCDVEYPSYWQQCKLSYLRKHQRLNFDSMRQFKLPNQVIRQVLLDELIEDVKEVF